MSEVKTCTTHLFGYIDEKKSKRLMLELEQISNENPGCDIDLVINSPGGHVPEGAAIYSLLRSMSRRGGGDHFITTIVRGLCGSMATLIFEAGDFRVGGPLDVLLYHEARMSAEDEFVSTLRQRVKSLEAWDEAYIDILMERATVPRKTIKALNGPFDKEIMIAEAVKLGLADQVI